jgi:hypothetical protein
MLSLLEPAGRECRWVKLDALTNRRKVLASFQGGCQGGRIAMSADQSRGAVWFDPKAEGRSDGQAAFAEEPSPERTPPRLFTVDMASGHITSLALPVATRDLGYSSDNRLLALTVQPLSDAEIEKGIAVVDGRPVKLEPANQGVAILAHAWVRDGASWKRIETVNSTDGWDLGLGVLALNAAKELGFRSAEVLLPQVQGDDETDPAMVSRLAAFATDVHPQPGYVGWVRFGTDQIRLAVWEDGGDFAYSTGLLAFVDPRGTPTAPPSWPFSRHDFIAYSCRGPYLLAAVESIGSHPRLYQNGRPVWSADTARAVTFWPRPHGTAKSGAS